MPLAVARLTGESWHRVAAICGRYVDLTLRDADYSGVTHLAIDETNHQSPVAAATEIDRLLAQL
jgi:hypothetical protein